MTFCISLSNSDQIIQVTDRRLTGSRGELIDDSVNKMGHAICGDVTFLYCFTGLPRVGRNHITSRWILDALYEVGQTTNIYRNITVGLTNIATRDFQNGELAKIPASARRLTIMLTGYGSDGHIYNALISNFQDFTQFINHTEAQPNFKLLGFRSTYPIGVENPTCVQAIGQFNALTAADEAQLRQLLERRAPGEAIRKKAISLVQDIADRRSARDTVGKKVSTARLMPSQPFVAVVGFESDEIGNELPLLDQAMLLAGAPTFVISDAKLTTESPFYFPRAHRNAPCPCVSGQKYRLCHGKPRRSRHPGASVPL
jgi:hypothetical protein